MTKELLLFLIERELDFYRAKLGHGDDSFYQGAIWALEEVKREISTVDPMGLGGIWKAIREEGND